MACLVGYLGVMIEMLMFYCGNHSTIMLAKNPLFHAKTKHIAAKYHFILEDNHVEIVKVHTT